MYIQIKIYDAQLKKLNPEEEYSINNDFKQKIKFVVIIQSQELVALAKETKRHFLKERKKTKCYFSLTW